MIKKIIKKNSKKIATVLLLIVLCLSGYLFFKFHVLANKPSLLANTSFSYAIYDDKEHLLRLNVSKDDKYRLFVPLKQISPQMIEAVLLQEDQYFYWHFGVNPIATIKAFWKTYILNTRRIGASTITMQLARLYYHINSRTWYGKLKQIAYALQLELLYNKNEILEAYLNLAPYGQNIEGVGAASLAYFAKPVSDVNLTEAITLAVMPQNPARHVFGSKTKDLQEARQNLWRRWCHRYPKDQVESALLALPMPVVNVHQLPFLAPHLVTNVMQMQSQQYTLNTTLDIDMQSIVEKVVRIYLERKKNLGVTNAAALIVDTRDMKVKALLGSADFWRRDISGQINGTTMKRSPGSTLKPFIYALALDQGLIHPATILKDVPTSFAAYDPENFDRDYVGPVSAKNALILSRNIPAIDLANKLNDPNLYQFLQRAEISGLKPESNYGLSLVLGGAEVSMQELAMLYASLANGGIWRPLRMLQNDLLLPGKRLLSPEASFLVLDMLRDAPRPQGYASTLMDKRKIFVAWKTGTSSAFRDAWTVGFVGPYVLAVWLGDFHGKSNAALVGKDIAAPLFFKVAEAVSGFQPAGKMENALPDPHNLHLVKIPICKASGMLPSRYCVDTVSSWFIPGKSPIAQDNIFREVAIDKKTGLRVCDKFNQNVDFVVYEFWPSDLLKLWQAAGIKRRVPPPFVANCVANKISDKGVAPQIISPRAAMHYVINLHKLKTGVKPVTIPFTATVDGDVKKIYWFVNKKYIGSVDKTATLWWQAEPGKFVVRAIDDRGRSNAVDLLVNLNST